MMVILHETLCTFIIIFRLIFLRMRNVLDQNYRENQNTFYVQKLSTENRAAYEIMWKNMVQPNRLKMPI
jgi:hypothetical protein